MFYTTEYTREYSKLEYILPSFPSRVLGLKINFEFFRASTRTLLKIRVISSQVFSSKVPTLLPTRVGIQRLDPNGDPNPKPDPNGSGRVGSDILKLGFFRVEFLSRKKNRVF